MVDRRSLLRAGGAAAIGAAALTAFASGANPAEAITTTSTADMEGAHVTSRSLLPNPATDPVPNPPFPRGLNHREYEHLRTFDELDFDVFTHAQWTRLHESHAQNVRVHWPDGHYTDGIDTHIEDLKALFVWAPDTRIVEHPLRLAMNELTAVTGVMRGTFTRPMPDGKGGFVPPTGKAFAINMATVGIWNRHGNMDEEFLFWDNLTFYQQIGIM